MVDTTLASTYPSPMAVRLSDLHIALFRQALARQEVAMPWSKMGLSEQMTQNNH